MSFGISVWKNAWLPFSETFIADQINYLERTDIKTLGFHNLPQGLMRADYAPYPNSVGAKAARVVAGVRPFKDRYLEEASAVESRLIHAHFGVGGLAVRPLAQALDVPIVTTFHGADHSFGRSRQMSALKSYRESLKRLHEGRGHALAVSEYIADQLMTHGIPSQRITVHYTGTRVSELQTAQEPRGIVFVGRLLEIKGCQDLLSAVALLPASLRNVRVSVVGDGPLKSELEQYARREGLNVSFLGRKPSSDIPGILAEHQIFCGPSLPSKEGTREGFGMTFVEAAMQALPVVAYASGGVKEAVEDGSTGLLASEGEITALSRNLRVLLEDPALAQELGKAGRSRALELFDVRRNTQALEQYYREVAEKESGF